MRIFVTGASGYIGNGVAKAFARAGHKVVGLVRSETAAKELQKNEICPVLGSLENLPKAAKEAEVIIHCAFESAETEASAIEAFIHLAPKTLVYTSGVWVYGNRDHTVDETSPLTPLPRVKWRPAVEEKVLKSPLKSVVIRPGHVYGYCGGLTALLFEGAAQGKLEIASNGENRWSIVHLDDLANLYLLAVEKELTQTILNGTENSSIKLKDFAEATAKLAHTQAHYLPYAEAIKHFGSLAEGLAVNQVKISNERAAHLLNWIPRHNHLLPELEHYWRTWQAGAH